MWPGGLNAPGWGLRRGLGMPPLSRCPRSLQPYADPVHDSTWRWWKDKEQDQVHGRGLRVGGGAAPHPTPRQTGSGSGSGADLAPPPMPQDYYFYLASNGKSAGNMHIDMDNYEKIYDLTAEHKLPERIFLDKGTSYRFSIFLTVRGHSFSSQPELGLWARPEWSSRGGAGSGDKGTISGAELWSGLVRGPNPALCSEQATSSSCRTRWTWAWYWPTWTALRRR